VADPVAGGHAIDAMLRDLAREADPARYLSALMAPEPARTDLIALHAFAAEIARIPGLVREPMLGEIRLQWWRDALAGLAEGASSSVAATGNPVADRLLEVAARHGLPPAHLHGLIDARQFDLGNAPMPDQGSLEAYLAKCEGGLINLAARILGAGEGPTLDRASRAAGLSIGLLRLLSELPRHLAAGALVLPADLLSRHGLTAQSLVAGPPPAALEPVAAELLELAEHHRRETIAALATMPPQVLVAFLPLALVPQTAKLLRAQGSSVGNRMVEMNPLRRILILWRARLLGRLG
jgi:15-cis-phytoene synthase